ncbi:hypothetical protein [Paraburkholderia dipogonis]|uniref:hypothetical protein n=1 Tax=Paraburkholderia dipogonis TaxID=1211383 RepID=UPI0038B9D6C5
MTDLSVPPDGPAFDPPAFESEQIETRCFGVVTVSDVGAEQFEALLAQPVYQQDTNALIRALLVEGARGANGERLTDDLLTHLPARGFHDRVKLMTAAARVNGLSTDEVEKG